METKLLVKVIVVSVVSVVLTISVIVGVGYAANIFTVDKDGTVRMVISDTGDVGIGTATPAGGVHMYRKFPALDAGDNLSSRQANINIITLGNGATNLGNVSTKGWHLVARGDGYADPNEQNDLMLFFWNGSAWDVRQSWNSSTRYASINGNLVIVNPSGESGLRIQETKTPTGTADASGNTGDIAWDGSYIYTKTGAGWKRAALSTW